MDDIRVQWRELVRSHCLRYDAPANGDCWVPELEMAPADRIREIQSEKLAVAFRYLWECSPLYRRKFEEAGLGPDSIRGVDDLQRIPLTHREEWLEDQRQNPPWGTFSPLRHQDWLERGWMFFSTSGTTAAFPRIFRHTTFDRDVWTYLGARGLYSMGVRRGDIAINCFSYGTSVAFWGMHYSLNHMGIPVISGGGASTERRAMFIRNYGPTVLMCTPSYSLYLGRSMQEAGTPPADSAIRLVIASGEPGACVPATKRRVEELWGAEMHDHFGCTEVAMPPLGYSCTWQVQRKEGLVETHLMEDVYIPEALDPVTLKPVPDGQPGILVVSNLYSEAQPILRYVMGDWITITRTPCGCGRTHARAVGGLRGRNDKLIKIRGLMFYPAVIEDALRSLPELSDEFRVVIDRVADMDRVKATVEPGAAWTGSAADLQGRVARSLKGSLGIRVDVEVVDRGTLPRVEFKADRLADLRDKLPPRATASAASATPTVSSSPAGWTPPASGRRQRVLYFTRSTGFEHSVVARHDGNLAHSERILTELGCRAGFDVECSQDGGIFDADLDRFDAFVFYTLGDLTKTKRLLTPPMSPEGKQRLLDAIAAGRGFFGFHAATDTFYGDGIDPYIAMLGGEFCGHGPQQEATLRLASPQFPGLAGLAEALTFYEEWYVFKKLTRDMHVIYAMDTGPMQGNLYRRPTTPSTWARRYGKGRVFYTSLGHREDIWLDARFQQIAYAGLAWVLGNVDADVAPNFDHATPGGDQYRKMPPEPRSVSR